jgi:lysophospholipase L1-like esterase
MKLRFLALAACVALLGAAPALAETAVTGYPNSMAATGDSITRAFNTGPLPFTDWPPSSWSTGSSSAVNSHYRRILAANWRILGRNFNDARSGAEMDAFRGQAATAVAQRVEYVTVLLGANDVCAGSEAGMTPLTTFEAELVAGMNTLTAGLPSARVYVVSIPDVYRLWEVLHTNPAARFVWTLGGICQSMLVNPGSTAPADVARRQRVRDRNIAYNTVLAEVCSRYLHCHFDGNAAFNTDFLPSDVSTRDYFHPSTAGQAKAARVTWEAGFDFTDAAAPMSSAQRSPATGGTTVTLTAVDNVAVRGVEYRLGAGAWKRYSSSVTVPTGTTLTWRAVDVNGNVEATKTATG